MSKKKNEAWKRKNMKRNLRNLERKKKKKFNSWSYTKVLFFMCFFKNNPFGGA